MKCHIVTVTKQCEASGFSLFDAAFSATELLYDGERELDPRKIDTITTYFDGELTIDGDDVRISYKEDDASGMGGSDTVIAFKKSDPCEVTLTRSGVVSTIMLFSKGRRTISVYNTDFMSFDIGVFAQRVENNILTDGTLEILYLIEVKGALAQKTELKLGLKTYD